MDKSIIVEKLVKNYTITKKQKGLGGSIASIINPQKTKVRALKGISFSVSRGEIVGFIGPNGAGKTTTLKILSGLLYPTSGFTQVLGFDPWEREEEYLKKISLVMGQKNQLWWDLPAIDTFELNRAIYEIEDRKYKKTFDELVSLLGVSKLLDVQVRRLSLGQRMRLELMASLLHSPEVLFLDEPTIGLDVVAQQSMRDFIEDYAKKFKFPGDMAIDDITASMKGQSEYAATQRINSNTKNIIPKTSNIPKSIPKLKPKVKPSLNLK